MELFKYLLNSPWTMIGLFLSVLSIPTSVSLTNGAAVICTKTFWWHPAKGLRAMTLGNVVILGPNLIAGDLEHEYIHVEQHMKKPLIHPILALIELKKHGHNNSKYEREAYQKAGNKFIPYMNKKF